MKQRTKMKAVIVFLSFLFLASLAVIDQDSCEKQSYSGDHRIVGFATLEIFAARCGKNSLLVRVPDPPVECPIATGSGDFIGGILRCDMTEIEYGGCGFFGQRALRMRLTQ